MSHTSSPDDPSRWTGNPRGPFKPSYVLSALQDAQLSKGPMASRDETTPLCSYRVHLTSHHCLHPVLLKSTQ